MFERDWSTRFLPPKINTVNIILAARFKTSTAFIQTIGLSDMAAIGQDGSTESSIVFPWSLRFEPTGEFSMPTDTYS